VKRCYDSGVEYDHNCDWFSFGVVMYELAEKAFPFGDFPVYESIEKEYIQPSLLGDDGETEVPAMYELLAGLLDWDPNLRLGTNTAELMAHPYWLGSEGHAPDWELIGKARMPSPLLPIVNQRLGRIEIMEAQGGGDVTDAFDEKAVELAEELAAAEKQQNEADQGEASNSANSKLMSEYLEYLVEDWDFSSEQAIAREYIENHTDLVSAL